MKTGAVVLLLAAASCGIRETPQEPPGSLAVGEPAADRFAEHDEAVLNAVVADLEAAALALTPGLVNAPRSPSSQATSAGATAARQRASSSTGTPRALRAPSRAAAR